MFNMFTVPEQMKK
uniref:Uncharacterized protein n=1 Tax=Anguilla anguilla TaxID=7936 RepID=A0A0E9UFN7_ANGAN